MTKCQHCGKELNEAEVKSNYCFECGKTAGIQSTKEEPALTKPQPKPTLKEPAPKETPKETPKESIRCPNCNFLNPKDTKSCKECAAPLAENEPIKSKDIEKRTCPNCGKEVKEHWKTCPQCGKPLIMEETKKETVEEMNKCPCGKEVESDWLSCPYCGKPLIKKKKEDVKEEGINKCSNCGKEVKKEWSICPFCQTHIGQKVEEKIVKSRLIFPDKSEKEITNDELMIGREDFEECQRKAIITKEQLGYITRRSKPHFKILNRNNKFIIIDENSANGTWVNGTMIEKKKEHELQDNNEIILANEKEIKIQFKIIKL